MSHDKHANPYHNQVPTNAEFEAWRVEQMRVRTSSPREPWLPKMDELIRSRFEYIWSWAGVPIIRLPEDLIMQQELIMKRKFTQIVEFGIARAGGLIFSADMQELSGLEPNVIGIDNNIHDHAYEAVASSRNSSGIRMLEADSIGLIARERLAGWLDAREPTLFILDSHHTRDHVLAELLLCDWLGPPGSVAIVCDTIIDELGPDFFSDRPWSDGIGPLTAVTSFLESTTGWTTITEFSRKGVLTEIRDGVLEKLGKREIS